MATVKIGQIKATLGNSIAYIVNPAKTDEGRLVSTFGCAPLGADAAQITRDFLAVQTEADAARTVGKPPAVQGLHIIQSFKPGELSAELAHQVGAEFAQQISGGQYQWVLATHTDRGHIHNHIIMNPVNMDTLQRYRTPKGRIFELRELSDELCRQHGLSVVENPQREQERTPLGERYARVGGRSTKDELRGLIDQAAAGAASIKDLIARLNTAGVEVTFRGRSMLVRDRETMQRPLRAWRLGPAYSESNLAARIGESPVVTFTVKPSMVVSPHEGQCLVQIPGLGGNKLVVPATALVDHGTTVHMHLPEAQTTPVVDREGNYQGAFTPEQLSAWFTPLTPERVIDPARHTPPGRGRTDAQRRYFASVDRKVANFAYRMEQVNQRAEIARMTPKGRAETLTTLLTQQRLRNATMQQLLIRRDQADDPERAGLDKQIVRLQRTIAADQRTSDLLADKPTREQATRTTTRKGQRR